MIPRFLIRARPRISSRSRPTSMRCSARASRRDAPRLVPLGHREVMPLPRWPLCFDAPPALRRSGEARPPRAARPALLLRRLQLPSGARRRSTSFAPVGCRAPPPIPLARQCARLAAVSVRPQRARPRSEHLPAGARAPRRFACHAPSRGGCPWLPIRFAARRSSSSTRASPRSCSALGAACSSAGPGSAIRCASRLLLRLRRRSQHASRPPRARGCVSSAPPAPRPPAALLRGWLRRRRAADLRFCSAMTRHRRWWRRRAAS